MRPHVTVKKVGLEKLLEVQVHLENLNPAEIAISEIEKFKEQAIRHLQHRQKHTKTRAQSQRRPLLESAITISKSSEDLTNIPQIDVLD